MIWRESPKGYCLYIRRGEVVTVFWDTRKRSWKIVHNGVFSDTYADLDGALDAAEFGAGVRDRDVDRSNCEDVPPQMRGAQQSRYEEPLHAQQGRYAEYRRSYAHAHRQQTQPPRQAPDRSGYRPAWVITLQLTGFGPWTLDQAKSAYRTLAMQHHPDRGGSAAVMTSLNHAWEQAQLALGHPKTHTP